MNELMGKKMCRGLQDTITLPKINSKANLCDLLKGTLYNGNQTNPQQDHYLALWSRASHKIAHLHIVK